MEKLKREIPETLKQKVAESTNPTDVVFSTSLLQFFNDSPLFHQMIGDLIEKNLCGKKKEVALELKQKANQAYLSHDNDSALTTYSQALRVAPLDAMDGDKNLVATLYLNRATLFHKIGLFKECVRDCDRALQIFPSYSKAWYRRGKANAALENYEKAVEDLKIAKNMETSTSGRKQIEDELYLIGDQYEFTRSTKPQQNEDELQHYDEVCQNTISSFTMPYKGRGMASLCDIPKSSLVHEEEPYALMILKTMRETLCHYCLNELSADTIPCISCSIPLYCSQRCQEQATGETLKDHFNNGTEESLSQNLQEFNEHKHECLGVNWPAVLPSDIVLAGRMVAKSIFRRRGLMESEKLDFPDLCHNYSQICPDSKLELHIYAAVLLNCLHHSFRSEFPINEVSLSQIVILISQIRVNSMAVVRMISVDVHHPGNQCVELSTTGNAPTSCVEQVKVGQAIYTVGSLFNHSCQPNIHAYFISRTLFVRTTKSVLAGSPLELSYGPQVGQWDCKDRVEFLDKNYSFHCQCTGCLELNPSDLVLNAYHCINTNCNGVVLYSSVMDCEMQKLKNFSEGTEENSLHLNSQGNKVITDGIASLVLETRSSHLIIQPGCCLSCGSPRDLDASLKAMIKAWDHVKMLRDAVESKRITSAMPSDASKALSILRKTLHKYNKHIAEMNDIMAQAFCLIGDLQTALEHCRSSIEVLEALYGLDHVAIGYEVVKLASIQLSAGEKAAVESVNRAKQIFSIYYGLHADLIFPYLGILRSQASNLVQ